MAKKTTDKNKPPEKPELIKFRKEKILTFERYRERRDLLAALLTDEKEYTIADVNSAIEHFMKG